MKDILDIIEFILIALGSISIIILVAYLYWENK